MSLFKAQHKSHRLHKPSLITIGLTACYLSEILELSLPVPVRSCLINTDSDAVPIQALHSRIPNENRNLHILDCQEGKG